MDEFVTFCKCIRELKGLLEIMRLMDTVLQRKRMRQHIHQSQNGIQLKHRYQTTNKIEA